MVMFSSLPKPPSTSTCLHRGKVPPDDDSNRLIQLFGNKVNLYGYPGISLATIFIAVPHVIGLDGRPMPRKAIKTKQESDDKFWDFTRQFFFGLWGFQQRADPPGRPIDVAQAIGYKRLEKRYYDYLFSRDEEGRDEEKFKGY